MSEFQLARRNGEDPVQGVWLKKCPRCGNYMKKADPEECGMCCACGWQERNGPIFCEVISNYCYGEMKR